MVNSAAEIQPEWVNGKNRIGVSAGASAPDILVTEVISRLSQLGSGEIAQLVGVVEKAAFGLPKDLEES